MQRAFILLITLLFILESNLVLSQRLDSVMNIYASQYAQEKIHIHFDKSAYNKGDTIWFKAYLLAGTELVTYSKQFYVDWYDVNGKLIRHTASPIFESSAKGQFAVPKNYAGQSLHVRAYTSWMLNFDSSFLFNKDITVAQPPTSKQVLAKPVTTLQFFPEGGEIVNGLGSTIAFLATDQSGKPVSIAGTIKNNKGEWIDTIVSVHDGMGSFTLSAQPNETYTALWTDEFGKSYTTALPPAKPTGAGLHVASANENNISVIIKRTEQAEANSKVLYVMANINQQMVYMATINLGAAITKLAEIPVKTLPTGVLQITLFDRNWIPIAERVLFINNHQYQFNPQIKNIVKGLEKRNKNVIEINVPDSIQSNLSIAVTDAGLPRNNNNTIISQLLLCGDIKGYINNPAYYFSGDADSLKQNLDLVMLTHGWRRFKWEEMVKGRLPSLIHQRDSDYIQLKGKALVDSKMKIPTDQKIFVSLQTKDSSRQTFFLPVRADGSFIKNGLIFFDTVKAYYSFPGNEKLMDKAKLVFQNGLLPQDKALTGNSMASSYLWQSDTAGLTQSRFFAAQQEKLNILLTTTTLPGVTVRATRKTHLDSLDEKYTSGLFTGDTRARFDLANDPIAQSGYDLVSYLQIIFPFIQSGGGSKLYWRGGETAVYLNEHRMEPEDWFKMQIWDIEYIKIFSPPFIGAFLNGPGGAIAIYTRKGNSTAYSSVGGLNYQLLEGYTAYKEFYSPKYNDSTAFFLPDVRSTLYWNPYILTDATNHTIKLEFYNNDISRKLRIVLEGMNAEGKLARVEKVIE